MVKRRRLTALWASVATIAVMVATPYNAEAAPPRPDRDPVRPVAQKDVSVPGTAVKAPATPKRTTGKPFSVRCR
jgi:hypothetical protein